MFHPTEFKAELRNKRGSMLLALVLLLGLAGYVPAQTLPTPPPQPLTGPGGSNYFFGAVLKKGPYWAAGHLNDNNFRYFTFEPTSPTPPSAPVILFLHGYGAFTPGNYQVWLNHMVGKGYLVIWVQYQAGALTPPATWLNHILTTYKDALNRLTTTTGHVLPAVGANGQILTGIVGHSAGAWMSFSVAELASNPANGLPKPVAVVSIEPGIVGLVPSTPTFADIDPTTKLIVVVGANDTVVCVKSAKVAWAGTAQIPASSRNFLVVQSDSHGSPAQLGNHFFPNTNGFNDTAAVDDRDFNVTWKLSVGAMNCALNNTDCTFALGSGDFDQVNMAIWSDGVPVTQLQFLQDPSSLVLPCGQ